jgi:hypothetical protein
MSFAARPSSGMSARVSAPSDGAGAGSWTGVPAKREAVPAATPRHPRRRCRVPRRAGARAPVRRERCAHTGVGALEDRHPFVSRKFEDARRESFADPWPTILVVLREAAEFAGEIQAEVAQHLERRCRGAPRAAQWLEGLRPARCNRCRGRRLWQADRPGPTRSSGRTPDEDCERRPPPAPARAAS